MPFINKTGSSIGTVTQNIYTVPATKSSIILELDVCNIAQVGVTVDVELYDYDNDQSVKLVSNIPIPVGSTVKVIDGQKIVVNEFDEVRLTSNTADSIDVIASVLEDV